MGEKRDLFLFLRNHKILNMDLHTKHKKNESSFRVCKPGWTNFVPNIIKIAFKMNRWEFFLCKFEKTEKIAIELLAEVRSTNPLVHL